MTEFKTRTCRWTELIRIINTWSPPHGTRSISLQLPHGSAQHPTSSLKPLWSWLVSSNQPGTTCTTFQPTPHTTFSFSSQSPHGPPPLVSFWLNLRSLNPIWFSSLISEARPPHVFSTAAGNLCTSLSCLNGLCQSSAVRSVPLVLGSPNLHPSRVPVLLLSVSLWSLMTWEG